MTIGDSFIFMLLYVVYVVVLVITYICLWYNNICLLGMYPKMIFLIDLFESLVYDAYMDNNICPIQFHMRITD